MNIIDNYIVFTEMHLYNHLEKNGVTSASDE